MAPEAGTTPWWAGLKPGVTLAQAVQRCSRVAQEIMRGFPPGMASSAHSSGCAIAQRSTVSQARPLVRTLFLAVAVVLFIACANLAGLLLVRVIRRRREIAVRLALGASGAIVLRQSLIEALVLSVGGGLVGLAIAAALLARGRAAFCRRPCRASAPSRLTGRLRVSRFCWPSSPACCAESSRPFAAVAHQRERRAQRRRADRHAPAEAMRGCVPILVVAELAVALVLLTASGLLLRSFQKMRTVDLGFRTDHVLTARMGCPTGNTLRRLR